MMTEETIYKLIEIIGDDAKTVFITYLVLEFFSVWLIIGLITWGVRTLWKKRNEWLRG